MRINRIEFTQKPDKTKTFTENQETTKKCPAKRITSNGNENKGKYDGIIRYFGE